MILESPVFRGNVRLVQSDSELHKPGSITNDSIAAAAAIGYGKQVHYQLLHCDFDKAIGAAAGTDERTIAQLFSSGAVDLFTAGMTTTGDPSETSIFDLKINGSSMLRTALTVSHSDTNNTPYMGDLDSVLFGPDDILTISVVSTGGAGPFACVGIYYADPT